MRILCVDDEPLTLEYTVQQCAQLPGIPEVKGFTRPKEALAWFREHPADLALLDIDMPKMDGITLAKELKKLHAGTAIIFLTAYREFAYDAFAVHPSGYLLKPVMQEDLAREAAHALDGLAKPPHILAQTFISFDLLVDGKPVAFSRSKSKELLAYLVDRQGRSVTRAEVFAALWGDRPYDVSMQKQLDVYIRSLRETLRAYGIDEILEMNRGMIRVVPERFACDLYRFLAGDAQTVSAYSGEYMSAYSWASETEAMLSAARAERGKK